MASRLLLIKSETISTKGGAEDIPRETLTSSTQWCTCWGRVGSVGLRRWGALLQQLYSSRLPGKAHVYFLFYPDGNLRVSKTWNPQSPEAECPKALAKFGKHRGTAGEGAGTWQGQHIWPGSPCHLPHMSCSRALWALRAWQGQLASPDPTPPCTATASLPPETWLPGRQGTEPRVCTCVTTGVQGSLGTSWSWGSSSLVSSPMPTPTPQGQLCLLPPSTPSPEELI